MVHFINYQPPYVEVLEYENLEHEICAASTLTLEQNTGATWVQGEGLEW